MRRASSRFIPATSFDFPIVAHAAASGHGGHRQRRPSRPDPHEASGQESEYLALSSVVSILRTDREIDLHGRVGQLGEILLDGVVLLLAKPAQDFRQMPDGGSALVLSLIHISEPTRLGMISYAVFCL